MRAITKLLVLTTILWAGAVPLQTLADAGHDHEGPPATAGDPARPTVTAVSDSFELVGRLMHDELSILVDRRATTEPVMNASLRVEVNGQSADAKFHEDHGDYSLNDKTMLDSLKAPGRKSLMFTMIAGKDTDLLTGELDVHVDAASAGYRHGWKKYALWIAIALLALLTLIWFVRRSTFGGAA